MIFVIRFPLCFSSIEAGWKIQYIKNFERYVYTIKGEHNIYILPSRCYI